MKEIINNRYIFDKFFSYLFIVNGKMSKICSVMQVIYYEQMLYRDLMVAVEDLVRSYLLHMKTQKKQWVSDMYKKIYIERERERKRESLFNINTLKN